MAAGLVKLRNRDDETIGIAREDPDGALILNGTAYSVISPQTGGTLWTTRDLRVVPVNANERIETLTQWLAGQSAAFRH